MNKSESNHLIFNFHVVALIDLMGQSEELSKFERIPASTNSQEFEEFINVAKKTVGRVQFFRSQISSLHSQLTREIKLNPDVKSKLTEQQLELARKYLSPKIDIQFFSDLALLKINLIERDAHSPLVSINNLFQHLSILILNFLSGGMPLRGAIDAGICVELNDNDLYGQAVSKAYELESESADYPRIVIGAAFLDFLEHIKTLEVTEAERIIEGFLLDNINGCIERDQDGVSFLSYLADPIVQGYSSDPSGMAIFQKSIKDASQFISNEINRYEKEGKEKLSQKYSKLKSYFESKGYWAP